MYQYVSSYLVVYQYPDENGLMAIPQFTGKLHQFTELLTVARYV